ncbi:MAG: hypothetical protein OHK93_006952 [Ramalina farinacea]|uniref:Uncharacterized protein n=1 Tax=Ramalina farinacea TaxID=258253 RepID=A0AA43TQK0_9LECA|nr:hypothetical protein [Ramalina farinacea]
MSSKEQPPHGTYLSKSSRSGLFHPELTTSPLAVPSPSRDNQLVERSTTGHSHTFPKSKEEQMGELVETINTYRLELDKTTRNTEDLTRRYKDLERRNESLESLNRSLKSQNEDLQRRNESLQQELQENQAAHGIVRENQKQVRQTTNMPLAIMPFQPSQHIVQRSTIPASAQQHVDHLSDNLNHLFRQAEIWAGTHANSPVPAALQSVTKSFKERQLKLAIPSQLLHDPNTLRHVMTKLILFAMIEATFQPQCFEHFKPEFGDQLTAERRNVYGGIPSQERKALAEARSGAIKKFVRDPNWAGFLNNFVSSKCGEIWQMLRPVFGAGAAAAAAWPSFVGLFRQAVSIALTMHQRVCLFRIDFPPTGEKSCYNPAVMQTVGSTGSEWQPSAGAGPQRLRLAATPIIYETTWGVNGAMGEPKPICKANVLLE